MRKLTKKQLEVMKVLWDNNRPMISSEIEKSDPSFNTNTVQACLRELLKKGYIQVADIVYSGTVLTRSYLPTFTKTDYLKDACREIIGSGSWLGRVGVEAGKGDWNFGLGYSYQKGSHEEANKWFVNVEYSF